MSRQELYQNLFSARALCVTGLLIMPALLFNPSTELRVVQFFFFWFLAWLSGKKTNPIITIIMIVFITAFNLIVPYGRVLFSIGVFKITSGALTAGVHRAFTLAALVMLSKVTIRQDLNIPGAFGKLLSDSLCMFSAIMNRKYRITGKNLIVEIDNLMLELSEQDRPCARGNSRGEELPQATSPEQKTKPAGYVVLAVIIILSWLSGQLLGNFIF